LQLKTPGKIQFPKIIAIYLISKYSQLYHSKIAIIFNLHSASIGAILKRCNSLMKENAEFAAHLKELDLILMKQPLSI